MATIDLGKLGFVNKGTYNNSTTYEKNDLVQFTDGGILSTYLYIDSTAQSGQAPSSSGTAGSRWVYYAKGGAAGTDLGATLNNNEIAFKTNAGALDGLPIGTAGQALKVNSGANGYEFGTISSKLIGMEKVYFSDTAVSFSSESGTQLSGSTYYPNSAKISGTYNKQQSSSHILMLIKFSMGHSATNVHGSCAWITGQEGSYRNMGFDARQFGWYHDESSVGAYTANLGVWWNGASSSEVQGTGNKTFNFAPTVSGTRTHTHILNFNPYSSGTAGGSHTDAPNRNTHSEIIIMEYEA